MRRVEKILFDAKGGAEPSDGAFLHFRESRGVELEAEEKRVWTDLDRGYGNWSAPIQELYDDVHEGEGELGGCYEEKHREGERGKGSWIRRGEEEVSSIWIKDLEEA